ncbi:hypothetical protein [Microlunatus parietis]|uniref:Uncharacterized protein n=1 Tax=Microlunatus parietis TaxID=682979 RepID=A0A7Y9IBU0_9ACTN|nr:hypothetical protein [Microlunatus parietis]NYE72398.1 hypothetical protein [Microlunatus parietis]NYE72856.1 hypothetical protein [Microlunatus parietis]NYE73932.1 hypothetical protein [Microlunatus parietis]NYE74151.1 hypothetical protein [Microlunatus parietis]NYE75086.1 hypothetical protein [Microlunatus parietis]
MINNDREPDAAEPDETKIDLRDIHGPGFTQDQYRAALEAGYETGWWDDTGRPAPWPDDFLDESSGWQPEHGSRDATERSQPF